MFDVTALGEALIDFTYAGCSERNVALFEQNPGGAVANLLTVLSKMKLKTSFIGKVGDDMHGKYLRDVLSSNGIDIENLIMDEKYFTTLAFVSLKDGEREFSFARKPGADMMLRKDEINFNHIKGSKVFHVGSLSLTNEPSAEATLEAIKIMKEEGSLISYDPNYRAMLWKDRSTAMEKMGSLIPYVDIMKISDEESDLLTPYKEPEEAANYLIEQGVKLVTVTLGSKGAITSTKQAHIRCPGFTGKLIDTTGAGDCYFGSFIYQFLQFETAPEKLTTEELMSITEFANAAAAVCVSRRGGIPAMPTLEEVETKMKEK